MTENFTTTGFGEWTVTAPTADEADRYYAALDALSADQKADARVAQAKDLYGTDTAQALALLEAVLAETPAFCDYCDEEHAAAESAKCLAKVHADALKANAKFDRENREYDVQATGKRDNNLVAAQVRARFEREIRAMARGIVDADGLGVAFELQAMLDDAINARIAELSDPTKPANQRYSLQELANGSGMRKQSLSTRAQKGRAGQKSTRRGPAKSA